MPGAGIVVCELLSWTRWFSIMSVSAAVPDGTGRLDLFATALQREAGTIFWNVSARPGRSSAAPGMRPPAPYSALHALWLLLSYRCGSVPGLSEDVPV